MTDAGPLNLPNSQAVSSACLYNLKPSSVKGRSYRASVPATTSMPAQPSSTIVAYVPCGRQGTFLDSASSYIRFTVSNTDVATNYFNIDNLASSFINRLDIFHAGNLIDTITGYNVLYSYLKDMQLNFAESIVLSNVYGTGYNLATAANMRQGVPIYGQQKLTFCIPLLGSIFSGADSMLPLYKLNDDIRIELSLESNNIAVVQGQVSSSPWTISDFQLELNIVELDSHGIDIVESVSPSSQPCYLHSNSWRHYVNNLSANQGGTVSFLVPARFASLKAMHWMSRRSLEINSATASSVSCRINPCISQWFLKIGGYSLPQKPITLYNSTTTAASSEGFQEMQRAFHAINKAESCSGITFAEYNCVDMATADATIGGFAGTGQPSTSSSVLTAATSCIPSWGSAIELETFSQRDGLLLSGLNSQNAQVFVEFNVGYGIGNQTNQSAATLDFYANYDEILVIQQGIMQARY